MIKHDSKRTRTIAVTAAALNLLEFPGMTIDGLRTLREGFVERGGPDDEIDQMYYDAILAAIEILTNPIFS